MAEHHHHHHGHNTTYGKAFALGITLNLSFVIVQWIAGAMAGSMALIADAGHNLGDALGLGMAWLGYALSQRKPSQTFTYGLGRSSILAALFNALLLVGTVGAIAWESVRRLAAPSPVNTHMVVIVAAIGILVNGFTALLFWKGRKSDLNLQGAFLHMSSDALVSLGVVATALAVRQTRWMILDPIASILISLLMLYSTWGLLRDALRLILDAVPENISLSDVESFLLSDERILKVHDLHIWGTSTTKAALSAHVVIPRDLAPDPLLSDLSKHLHDQFEIEHCTLQIEHGDPNYPCVPHH